MRARVAPLGDKPAALVEDRGQRRRPCAAPARPDKIAECRGDIMRVAARPSGSSARSAGSATGRRGRPTTASRESARDAPPTLATAVRLDGLVQKLRRRHHPPLPYHARARHGPVRVRPLVERRIDMVRRTMMAPSAAAGGRRMRAEMRGMPRGAGRGRRVCARRALRRREQRCGHKAETFGQVVLTSFAGRDEKPAVAGGFPLSFRKDANPSLTRVRDGTPHICS